MAYQVIINIVMAFAWMLFQNGFGLVDFVIGYGLGLLILIILRRFLGFELYFRRVIAFIKLWLIFIRELIKANIDVLKIVLRPKLDFDPGIVAYETELQSDWEISTLAALISLTPGTLSMVFSEDGQTIYIHCIHLEDKQETINDFRETFEKAIMEVTH